MITIEFRLCGFGLKRRWEFGDPTRSPITVFEFGFIKICKFRGGSDLVSFMRGYCDNNEFDWHPKVRLAKRTAEKKAQQYYKKYYLERTQEWIDNYSKISNENSDLRNEKRALLKTIKLIGDNNANS